MVSHLELAHAARTAKGTESKSRHHYRIAYGDPHNPQNGPVLPLTPCDERAKNRKKTKKRAGSLMEKLARDTPDDTQRNLNRMPEGRKQSSRHGDILMPLRPAR